jgi:acrylyl-CoA reductase (NADPH)
MDTFTALLITRDENTKAQTVAVRQMQLADLMPGNVTVRVSHSTVNYKDGLAIPGKLPVVRRFPMIPGVDLAGTVLTSTHADFKPGDRVVLNGQGIGETHMGAYSQMARVDGDWLIPLPDGLSPAEAMAVGTAGFTAMLAIMALERHGITPARGAVVVTGAAGGVGSMAVSLLAGLGYTVHAVTGRQHEHEYLRNLGAAAIVERADLSGPAKPLAKERWAGGIDAVGGPVLANVLSAIQPGGAVVATGNAAGFDLPTTVAPFILRGVSLLGISSSHTAKLARQEAWARIARDLDRARLAAMTTNIDFHAIQNAARDIVAGKVRGRLVVEIG